MDAINIDNLLKNSSTFSSLDASAIQRILPCFSILELTAKEVLFYQGDPSTSVYILVKGKLSAELINAAGETRVVGFILPGESVGEMGALSNEPRTLTIKALHDAVLLKISTQDFIAICREYPSVMFAIMRPMITRTSSLIQELSTEKRNRHIVMMPANSTVNMQEMANKLLAFGENYGSTLIVSDYHADFMAQDMKSAEVSEKIKQYAHNKSTHRTLYILRDLNTPLARYALKRANMIYVTAYGKSKPVLDVHLPEIIESCQLNLVMPPSLVLLYPDNTATPRNTISWLKLAEFGLHHHVRMDTEKDWQRLFRFIRGKAVGVVLGGGGTRGWAHIGAIKALQTANIPIDIIGGTSVGALVAGMYAMSQSYDEVYRNFHQMVIESKDTISWRNLTWPVISLFNAKRYTMSQMNLFKDRQIEDLWLPYFCITSNLAHCTEAIHQSGTLWEKIRGSTAIPGLIPPMVINGEVHIDGGLLNNLPVDTMRRFIGSRGKVVAIELNDLTPDDANYHFPPIQTFKDALLYKLGLKRNKYKFPKMIDTFLRGLFLGSLWRNRQNAVISNIFVSLNLAKFHMLHSNPEEGEQLVKIGFEQTLGEIERTKTKNISPG